MFCFILPQQQKLLWFNIGSVDSLEKKMANIQNDFNIYEADHVNVIYKSQIESESLMGLLPTLVMGGLLLFGMFRMKSMMSGKGGGLFGGMSSIVKAVKPGDIQIRFK